MSKLWVVTKEIEVVVVANSREEAESVAEDHDYDILRDSAWDNSWFASSNFYLPSGWGDGCIPYGGEGDKTVGEYLEAQEAAEKERLMIAEFNAKQVTLDEAVERAKSRVLDERKGMEVQK